jgi:hypothetical protein
MHCERRAYVYVWQSTPIQVVENRESTERQYQLLGERLEWIIGLCYYRTI